MSYLISEDYLMHHGVKGMKWGVRHDKPSSGRKRSRYNPFAAKKRRNKRRQDYARIQRESERALSNADLSSLNQASKKFNKLGEELAVDYDNYYKSLKGNKDFADSVYKNLQSELGSGCDDEDLFSLALYDVMNSTLDSHLPKELSSKTQEFFNAGDNYFKEADKIGSSIAQKYSNVEVENTYGIRQNGKDAAKRIVNSNLTDSRWNSYMYRHFDDYWVRDVDSRYALENDFSMEEYNKKYATSK